MAAVMVPVLAFGLGLAASGGPATRAAGAGGPVVVAAPSVTGTADRADRSRDGAVAAAVQYAALMSRLFPLSPAQARRILADVASDSYRSALVAAVDAELVPLRRQLAGLPGSTVHRQSVLATRVDSYTDPGSGGGRARVSVWVLLAIGQSTDGHAGGRGNPVASFGTVGLDLVWQRGAWRLDATSQHAGPTPLLDGRPQTSDEFSAALAGSTDWRPA